MTEVKTWTKEEVREKLWNSQKWLERGILAIYEKQTIEEKVKEHSLDHNKVGFSGPDASYLSYIARWLKSGRTLSGKHFEKVRMKMLKYAGQLAKIANGEI